MIMDREEKKIMKDYVKSITKLNTRNIFEWTAGELKEYDFDIYQLESVYPENSFGLDLIAKSPALTLWYVRRDIRLGKIFLRLKKLDPNKPVRFRENGWAIRNQSSRADKTAFGRSMSFLSTAPKSRWKFWATE